MTEHLRSGTSDPSASDAPEGSREARADSVLSEQSTLELQQFRELVAAARYHGEMFDQTVLLNVAILWGHHLGIDKDLLVNWSRTPRSTLYKELPKTQEFVEKLENETNVFKSAFALEGDEGKIVCDICGKEVVAQSVNRKDSYPAMYRHWAEEHRWRPTATRTPERSDKHLVVLGSDPGSSSQLSAQQQSAARSELEAARATSPEIFRGASGQEVEQVLSEIVDADDAIHSHRSDSRQRAEDSKTARGQIQDHAAARYWLETRRNASISAAIDLRVPAKKIARMIGVSEKTVRRWGAEAQPYRDAMSSLEVRIFKGVGPDGEPPAALAGEYNGEAYDFLDAMSILEYRLSNPLERRASTGDGVDVYCKACGIDREAVSAVEAINSDRIEFLQYWIEFLQLEHWREKHFGGSFRIVEPRKGAFLEP